MYIITSLDASPYFCEVAQECTISLWDRIRSDPNDFFRIRQVCEILLFFFQLVNLCLSLKTEYFVSFQLVKKFIIRNHQNENSSLDPNKKAMDPQPSSIFCYIVYKMMGPLSVIFIPVQDTSIYLDFPYINPRLIPRGGFHISYKAPLLQGFLVYMLFTYTIIWKRNVLGSLAAQHQGFSSNNDFPETGCCRKF